MEYGQQHLADPTPTHMHPSPTPSQSSMPLGRAWDALLKSTSNLTVSIHLNFSAVGGGVFLMELQMSIMVLPGLSL